MKLTNVLSLNDGVDKLLAKLLISEPLANQISCEIIFTQNVAEWWFG